jgi:tetrahydromethanopterin S-methyltransferase subunit B
MWGDCPGGLSLRLGVEQVAEKLDASNEICRQHPGRGFYETAGVVKVFVFVFAFVFSLLAFLFLPLSLVRVV